MKRQLLFLVLASGLALMAAPNANAGKPAKAPGFCGHNYAMLMTGYEPNLTPATGSGIVAGSGRISRRTHRYRRRRRHPVFLRLFHNQR